MLDENPKFFFIKAVSFAPKPQSSWFWLHSSSKDITSDCSFSLIRLLKSKVLWVVLTATFGGGI